MLTDSRHEYCHRTAVEGFRKGLCKKVDFGDNFVTQTIFGSSTSNIMPFKNVRKQIYDQRF